VAGDRMCRVTDLMQSGAERGTCSNNGDDLLTMYVLVDRV
jgi:hypothetical protein